MNLPHRESVVSEYDLPWPWNGRAYIRAMLNYVDLECRRQRQPEIVKTYIIGKEALAAPNRLSELLFPIARHIDSYWETPP